MRRSSDDDIDVAVLLIELRRAQPEPVGSLVDAGLEVELVAVPRAHDVGRALVVGERPDRAVVGDRLAHALVDPALADRALPVRALVVPGHEPPVDLEHAHLDAVAGHGPAVAVFELVGAAYEVGLRHVRSVIRWRSGSGPGPPSQPLARSAGVVRTIAHVPEKWEPVFREGHAQTKEARGGFQSLFELDVGRLDDRGPPLHFGMHPRRELVRAATDAGARQTFHAVLEILRCCDLP